MPTVSGVVLEDNVPAQRLVRLYRRDNGVLLGRGVSDPVTGIYTISTTYEGETFIVKHSGTPTAFDPYWINVSLACHFDGVNASTTFTDEVGASITAAGGAQISTAQSKFSGASGYFNGSTAELRLGADTAYDFGTGPFTVRFFFRYTGTGNAYPLVIGSLTGWSAGAIALSIDHSFAPNKVCLNVNSFSTGTYCIANTTTVTYNTWHHVELVRSGTSLYMFYDGVLESTVTISAGLPFNFGYGGLRIGGGNWDGANGFYAGYLDELEMYKGVALHTSSFTVPTAPFLQEASVTGGTENALALDRMIPG